MNTLSDKVRFVQRKLKPEEAFTIKKWMVLAEHLLAQAHIYIYVSFTFTALSLSTPMYTFLPQSLCFPSPSLSK